MAGNLPRLELTNTTKAPLIVEDHFFSFRWPCWLFSWDLFSIAALAVFLFCFVLNSIAALDVLFGFVLLLLLR